MGYRNEFLTVTKGEGVLTSAFSEFAPKKQGVPGKKTGSLMGNLGKFKKRYVPSWEKD